MRALLFLPLCAALAQTPTERRFDVIVVGGSSGAVSAALAAGRMGARVALIEDTPVLGGMMANGISNIDTYSYESLSGIFEEFRARVRAHYQPVSTTDPVFLALKPAPRDFKARQTNSPHEGGRWEPRVADMIFKQMIAAVPNITVFYNTWATGAIMQSNRILGVTAENKQGQSFRFQAPITIDATHEADVAAWAGAPYRVGREPRSPREPHAGDITYFNGTGEFLPSSTGRQDRALVSSGLRLTIQHFSPTDGDAHILKTPPPNYNPANYRLAGFGGEISMPGRKTEMNANPAGNELQFINWNWAEASRAERQKLYTIYRDHALGFLYYVQNVRGWRHLGLSRDDFNDNFNVAYRIFVRESRRIVGEATMDEADVNPFVVNRGMMPEPRRDSIAIGHYAIDSKPVLPKTDDTTPDKGAGDFFLANVTAPFQVPYGAIVPKHIDGLLVPVALSATHVAFSAVRMDPTWVALGQAAGTAAVLALREKTEVRALNVAELQRELIKQKARLMFYWDVPLEHPAFAAIQRLSVSGVVNGFADRRFLPDAPLERAQAAALVVRAFGLWPSVSDFHYKDIAMNHWALRDIETLTDQQRLAAFGFKPLWPQAGSYRGMGNSGFARSATGSYGNFEPARTVTWGEFTQLMKDCGGAAAIAPGRTATDAITRGEAALIVDALR